MRLLKIDMECRKLVFSINCPLFVLSGPPPRTRAGSNLLLMMDAILLVGRWGWVEEGCWLPFMPGGVRYLCEEVQ